MDGPAWPDTVPDWVQAQKQLHSFGDRLVNFAGELFHHLQSTSSKDTRRQAAQRGARRRMAQILLAALPAALGAWVMAANVLSKDATSIILPAQLQALLDTLLGVRTRRRQAQRRRMASHLAPLTLEREWLFGALPPAVTANVLGRLDSLSRKALRATCRRTRLCVSGATPRLLLDGRGLRRFAIAPLHVLFPQLRELHLTGPQQQQQQQQQQPAALVAPQRGGPAEPGRVGSAAAATAIVPSAAGGNRACTAGPAQLLALLESGTLAAIPSLELLDISRWRRPACCFTRRDWQALTAALERLHCRSGGTAATSAASNRGAPSAAGARGGVGGVVGSGRPLVLRLDWRVLPLSSVWSSADQLPSWQEATWAVRWMARKAPQVRLELEGPPLPLPGPATLQALQGIIGLRRVAVQVAAAPPWALRRFGALSSLQGLRYLTLRLPEDVRPEAALEALQELHYLDQLALPATTLTDADMPLLARLRSLRTLLVGGLVLRGDASTSAAPAAAGPGAEQHGAQQARAHPHAATNHPSNGRGGTAGGSSGIGPARPGLERLVVSSLLDVDPHVGLLPSLPALSALGVRVEALTRPMRLLPQPRPPPPVPPAPPLLQPPQLQGQPLPGLWQELLQHQMAAAAPPPPAVPQPDIWAAAPAAANPPPANHIQLAAPAGAQPHLNHPLLLPPAASLYGTRAAAAAAAAAREQPQQQQQQVCLRELCIMYGKRPPPQAAAAARGAAVGAVPADRGVAAAGGGGGDGGGTEGDALAADLAAQAAELPTLQRLRLWRCRSPACVLRLLRPVAERLQLPLVLLELHDVGPPEPHHPPPPPLPPHVGLRARQRQQPIAPPAAAAAAGAGGNDDDDDDDDDDEQEDTEEDEEESGSSSGDDEAVKVRESSSQGQQPGSGAGAAVGGVELEVPVLLTSLLTWRPWRSTSDQLAALLLGCCRTLAVAGGHPALLASLAAVGRAATEADGMVAAAAKPPPPLGRDSGRWTAAAAAAGGGGGGVVVTTQRLMVRRQPCLDEALLRQLICGLSGLQVLGVAGCGGLGMREAMQARQGAAAAASGGAARAMNLTWASEA